MKLTLNQAAKEARKAKSTVLKAIRDGRLSTLKNSKGQYEIDPSELFRVFPKTVSIDHHETAFDQGELERLRSELAGERRLNEVLSEQVSDLRQRLDAETEERRNATKLLQASASDRRASFWSLFRK